jgi:ABC-type transport system substrate-binding protein
VVAAGAAFALTRSSGDQVVASEPQHGGTLRIGMHRTDESTVALYAGQPTRTQYALRMVLERLIVLDDKDQLRESVLEKALAENNGNDLVLTLRAGVMFHDSPGCMAAAEATAKDLEFSLTEAIAQHQLDLDIESMTANGRELRLHMKSPTLSFAQALSHVWLLPAKLADCDPDRTKLDHLVGSGPFKFAPSQLASALTLVKWEGYWRPNRPRLDRVELVTINDASLALAALHAPVTSTEALHIYIPDVATRRALIKDRTLVGAGTEGLELGTRTHKGDAGTWLLDVTHKPGPLQTVELRRAAAYAIDREAVVKVAAKNAAAPSAPFGGYLQPAALGFDYAAKPFTFDPTRAKELVYNTPGDKAITIGYSFNHDAAKVVADNLTAVGFTVELRKIELRDQSGVLARGEVDAMLISRWGDLVGDELVSIASFDQRRIAGTRALLAKLAGKTKRSERAAGYREIEAALFEHVPSIPIATLDPNQITFAAIVRPQVEGFHDHASGHVPYDDTLTFVETWLNAGVVEGPRVGSAH